MMVTCLVSAGKLLVIVPAIFVKVVILERRFEVVGGKILLSLMHVGLKFMCNKYL